MQLPQSFTSELTSIFVDRFSTAQAVRDHHGRDESPYSLMAPDGVVFARTNEEVAAVLRLCNQYAVPVIAFGAGTSLEGHLRPIHGGICLNLSQMNQILDVSPNGHFVAAWVGL